MSYVNFFRVRAKALQYFAQCATSEDRSLVLKVKEMLHEALENPADGTPTVNRQTRGGSDKLYLPHCGIFVVTSAAKTKINVVEHFLKIKVFISE